MGRSPCYEKLAGLKKGPWTPEEDQKLMDYIDHHGHGSWRALPLKAGLQRCGKSCRLRWINYLRPDIKRGKFTLQEEQTIIQLHALLGNRWSAIATHLPKRTDNEIKNYWNTHLKKRLTKMGIDPVTHKPKADALASAAGNPKDAANLSHMAQWESARLEAEARLVRESKVSNPPHTAPATNLSHKSAMLPTATRPQCLDVLKAWQGVVTGLFTFNTDTLESPTSTLNFMDHTQPVPQIGFTTNFVANSLLGEVGVAKDGGDLHKMDNDTAEMPEMPPFDGGAGCGWFQDSFRAENFMEGYDDPDAIVNCHSSHDQEPPENPPAFLAIENSNGGLIGGADEGKNYWNNILNNLVNTSPSNSPVLF